MGLKYARTGVDASLRPDLGAARSEVRTRAASRPKAGPCVLAAGCGVDDSAGKSGGHDLGELVDVEELGSGKLVLGNDEPVDLVLIKLASVKNDQQFVALGGMRAQSRVSISVRSTR